MRARAAAALAVLVVLPLVAASLLALTLAVALGLGPAAGWPPPVRGAAALVSVLLVLVGIAAGTGWRRSRPRPTRGATLAREEHPSLWRVSDALAASLGVVAPDRLVLAAGTGLRVQDVRGRRELVVGSDTLAGASVREAEAAVALELAGRAAFRPGVVDRAVRAVRRLDALLVATPAGPASALGRAVGGAAAGLLRPALDEYCLLADACAAELCGADRTRDAVLLLDGTGVGRRRLLAVCVPVAERLEHLEALSGLTAPVVPPADGATSRSATELLDLPPTRRPAPTLDVREKVLPDRD